jgi:branched-chain amino acid transport system substrate-binding protein
MRMRKVRLPGRLLGTTLSLALIATLVTLGGLPSGHAAAKTIKVGINLPLTGADAEDAELIKNGAVMAIEEVNAKGGASGYKIELVVLDDATATAGQYDPAQAATNAKKFVGDSSVVAAIGPQMSGSGKAMSPILSEGDLAIITPSSTNPDITDPKFASTYRPKSKAVYFRTVTTDAYQGPNMANYMAEKLKVKSIYVLDDSGAYGVGIADAFQKRAKEKGIKVLGRDQLNPKEADYTTILTKVKGLNPDALYYGGVNQAGSKLVKQAYDVIPKMIKAGGDGVYSGALLKGAGFPAVEGWYATSASPHLLDDPEAQPWVQRYAKRWGKQPSDYSITAYDAALVIIDAVGRVVKSGKTLDRHNIRDAIQATKLKTMQGVISFDANGDLVTKLVSVYQIKHNPKFPDDDVVHQYTYIGVAPEN